jgi:hypothetical protein
LPYICGFDKKRLISQDIQDRLRKNPSEVTLIKFFDTKRLSYSGHNRYLKEKKGLLQKNRLK